MKHVGMYCVPIGPHEASYRKTNYAPTTHVHNCFYESSRHKYAVNSICLTSTSQLATYVHTYFILSQLSIVCFAKFWGFGTLVHSITINYSNLPWQIASCLHVYISYIYGLPYHASICVVCVDTCLLHNEHTPVCDSSLICDQNCPGLACQHQWNGVGTTLW